MIRRPIIRSAHGCCAPGEYLVFLWPTAQMPDAVDEAYIKAHAAEAQRMTLQPGGRQSVDFVMPARQN
jgi:hypothetical protein